MVRRQTWCDKREDCKIKDSHKYFGPFSNEKCGLCLFPLNITIMTAYGFPGGKEPTCQCRRSKKHRLNPWVGRSPGGRHGNPLQYSCLENPMDRGNWRGMVHRITKSQTWLKLLTTTYMVPITTAWPMKYAIMVLCLKRLPVPTSWILEYLLFESSYQAVRNCKELHEEGQNEKNEAPNLQSWITSWSSISTILSAMNEPHLRSGCFDVVKLLTWLYGTETRHPQTLPKIEIYEQNKWLLLFLSLGGGIHISTLSCVVLSVPFS